MTQIKKINRTQMETLPYAFPAAAVSPRVFGRLPSISPRIIVFMMTLPCFIPFPDILEND